MLQKYALSVFVVCLFFASAIHAQKASFGPEEDMLRKNTSAITGSIVLGNGQYYLLENDYGALMDFKNNIRTHLRQYNLTGLATRGVTNINPLIEEGKDQDDILITGLLNWKNRIVAFYTLRGNPSSTAYPAYGRIFDQQLRPQGKIADLGDFSQIMSASSVYWQTGTLLNGRSKLNVVNQFHYRLSPDSSLLMIMARSSDKNNFNVKFNVFNETLEKVNTVSADIPIKTQKATLEQMLISNKGIIYLLVYNFKSNAQKKEEENDDDYVTELYSIDPAKNNEVKSVTIQVPQSTTLRPSLTLDIKGNPTVIGWYRSAVTENEKIRATGLFSIKIDEQTFKASAPSLKTFHEEFLINLMDERSVKRIGGYSLSTIPFTQFLPASNGGVFAVGQLRYKSVRARGTTGALNTYLDHFGNIVYCYIDPNGKIEWLDGLYHDSKIIEWTTHLYAPVLFTINDQLHVGMNGDNGLKKREQRFGINFGVYNSKGKVTDKFVELNEELQQHYIVGPTTNKINGRTILIGLVKPVTSAFGGQKCSVMKIDF